MRGFDEPWQADTSPERRVLVEILVDAIDCARGCAPGALPGEEAEARRWLASDDQFDAYTFCGLCQELGLEPDAVRARVAAMPPDYSASKAMHREYQTGGSVGRIDEAEVWKDPRWAHEAAAVSEYIQRKALAKERREAIRGHIRDGKRVSEIMTLVGISRGSVLDHVRAIERTDGPLYCPCGQRFVHRGWCPTRVATRPARAPAVPKPAEPGRWSTPLSPPERASAVELAQRGVSTVAIAKRLGAHPNAVRRALRGATLQCPCGRPLLHRGNCADRNYALQAYA